MKEIDIQNIASAVMGQLTSSTTFDTVKGCGSFSNVNSFTCTIHYECLYGPYFCGGAAAFDCLALGFVCGPPMFQCAGGQFHCQPTGGNYFDCGAGGVFSCMGGGFTCTSFFRCQGAYTP